MRVFSLPPAPPANGNTRTLDYRCQMRAIAADADDARYARGQVLRQVGIQIVRAQFQNQHFAAVRQEPGVSRRPQPLHQAIA